MECRAPVSNNPISIINHRPKAGSALLMVVLLAALLAAVVMGHLQVNAEEMQIMQNHFGGAEAQAIAEAGLHEALAQLRQDPEWRPQGADRPLGDGSYRVVVEGPTVTSTAVTSRGYVAKVRAEVKEGAPGSDNGLQIDRWQINP
jgi:Tfp pilus assembly protein PilX